MTPSNRPPLVKNNGLVLPFSEIRGLCVDEARRKIIGAGKKRLADITLYDLIIPDNHGIYFFFAPDGATCLYVGKNSSLQFVERMGSHFAVDQTSWHNHFLKYYKAQHKVASLIETAQAVADCRLLLMPVTSELISSAEKFFRVALSPVLNRRKARNPVCDDAKLEDAVENIA